MKKSELKQLIKEEIQKVLNENINTNAKAILQKYNQMKDGYYAFTGGTSFGKGKSSSMGDSKYAQFDADKANIIAYSDDEDKRSLIKYCQSKGIKKFTIVSIEDGNIDIGTY